jgi:hypothetical protein
MPPLDVSGFVSEAPEFEGLYRASETLEKRKLREEQLQQQKEGRIASTNKFLADYLDPKERLTGTNYDPEIVKQLGDVLQEGSQLAGKGANVSDIMMALGPKVNRINEYSTKAKLVNQNIKAATEKLKGYGGYNIAALEDEAKKIAFQDEKGGMKDISQVDPSMNYVSEATRLRPEVVTTGAGLDQFVNKTPVSTTSNNIQTSHLGRTRNIKYEATTPFWMDIQKDQQGNAKLDKNGNPVGLDIIGGPLTDDQNQPMINPETGEQYHGLATEPFKAIMQHNPDIADYMRGQINTHFKEAGAKEIPKEGSPQWMAMGQYLLGQELKTRDRSSFKTIDQEKASAPAIRMELGYPPYSKGGKGGSGGADTEIRDIYNEVDQIASSNDRVGKDKGAPLNELSASAQGIVLKYARDLTGKDLDQRDIYIKKEKDGNVFIMDAKNQKRIAPINFADVNLQANKGVKSQQKVLQSSPDNKSYQYKGKSYSEAQLKAAADKSGMTIEEYKKELGLK